MKFVIVTPGAITFTRIPWLPTSVASVLGKLRHRRFRQRVEAVVGNRDIDGSRRHVDDAPSAASRHRGQRRLATEKNPLHVDANDFVELPLRDVPKRPIGGDAGDVAQHIEAAPLTAGARNERLDLGPLRDVRRLGDGFASRFADGRGGFLCALGIEITQHHPGAGAGQHFGRGETDAARGAGDDRHPALQSKDRSRIIHRANPL